jgi:hypothetical protein
MKLNNELRLTFSVKMYSHTRGRELPGNYNHGLLAELFHFQSKRWRQIGGDHIKLIHKALKSFITALSEHITDEERISLEIKRQVNERLTTQLNRAEKELQILIEDEHQQPITYNHYYTDNVQKARQDASRNLINNIVKDTAGDDTKNSKKNSIDVERLVNALHKHVNANMDEQACAEVRADLDAYYKVPKRQSSPCGRKLIRCRSRSRHSSTMCANKSSNDTFFAHSQRSFRLKQ